MNINAKTNICMVIGDPVAHSLSPEIHNAGYEALGLDGQFVYIASDLASLPDFVQGAKAMKHLVGLSCTIPYKEAILPLLDEVDPVARKIGAVNTVVREGGMLKGYNTDWSGFLAAVSPHVELSGKKVALIGAGGAAKSVLYALMSKGADVTVYNRTAEKGRQLAEAYGCGSAQLEDIERMRSSDIIVNTTPVGMYPHADASPVAEDSLRAGQTVFDIVYTPYTTRLLQTAEAQGATIIRGHEMLLQQAALQFELFTGRQAPLDVMRDALLGVLQHET